MLIQGGKYGTLDQQRKATGDSSFGSKGSPASYQGGQAVAASAKAATMGATTPATPATPVSQPTQVNDPIAGKTTDGSDSTDYVPRFYQPESTVQTPQSVEEIQNSMKHAAQGQINSLRDYEKTQLDAQKVANTGNENAVRSTNVLNGLAGSSEANVAVAAEQQKSRNANEAISSAVETQVQGILANIQQAAIAEARAQRQDAAQATKDDLANQQARTTLANDSVKQLAASGATFDGLRKTDPQSFDYLARAFGSTEALKGAFVLNTPQDQILDKQVKDGSYIVATQNPITGKISIQTLDLGLPSNYSNTIDAGDRILAVPDNWDGDPSKLISISKGIDPSKATPTTAGYNGDFAATIDLAANANKSAPNVTKEAIKSELQGYIASGDYKSAYQGILQQTRAGLDTQNEQHFDNALTLTSTLSDLKSALQDYANAGGDTNILKGTEDQIQTKIGKLNTDPKYAALAVRLDTAYQNYRLMLTGANFSQAESAAYASVLPSKYNTLDLNLAKIDGAQQAANSTIEGNIKSVVGDGGIYIKQYAEGATKGGGDARSQIENAGYDYDAIKRDHPDMSDDELLQQLQQQSPGDFSAVGNTSVSISIPPSSHLSYVNNNPGNLRYAGQAGAKPGEGGFAAFKSAADGFDALIHQVQIDASRGLSLATFASKYAPPSENNTKKYIGDLVAMLGVSPNTPISQIPPKQLAAAVARKESSSVIA